MSGLQRRVDAAIEAYLVHRDAELFIDDMCAAGAGEVEPNELCRVTVERMLRKDSARSGGALMFLVCSISGQDQTRLESC